MGIQSRKVEFKGTLMEYLTQEVKMDRLINILDIIENDRNVSVKTQEDIICEIIGDNIDTAIVYSLADELLITEQGQCNWVNIRKLKNKGYDVFAGDHDSFGWLTGCIQTKRGILVYG